MKLKKKQKAMLASYGRSIVGATAALYVAGVTDPKDLWAALIGALIPVVARAVNPNDPAFGRLPNASVIEEALKTAKAPVKKAASKKAVAKKTTKK
jgi:hypothetical protein